MSTLAINSDSDVYFDDAGRLVTIAGSNSDEEILQRVEIRMRFFKGEWYLNTDHGLPYFQDILGSKTLDLNGVESLFRKAILDVEGIKELIESSIDYNGDSRKVDYFFRAVTINNTTVKTTLIDI